MTKPGPEARSGWIGAEELTVLVANNFALAANQNEDEVVLTVGQAVPPIPSAEVMTEDGDWGQPEQVPVRALFRVSIGHNTALALATMITQALENSEDDE